MVKGLPTIPYTKTQLWNLYYKYTDKLFDDLDWKTHISGEEMCEIVYDLINEKLIKDRGYKLPFRDKTLYNAYNKEVNKMNLSIEEWRTKYSYENKEHGVKELIEILHNIIASLLEKRSVIFEKKKKR